MSPKICNILSKYRAWGWSKARFKLSKNWSISILSGLLKRGSCFWNLVKFWNLHPPSCQGSRGWGENRQTPTLPLPVKWNKKSVCKNLSKPLSWHFKFDYCTKICAIYRILPLFIKKKLPIVIYKKSWCLQIAFYKILNFWGEYTPLWVRFLDIWPWFGKNSELWLKFSQKSLIWSKFWNLVRM